MQADAAAYVVVDTSRSMLAAPGPDAETRLERAQRVALRMRDALGDVPTGLVSLSDRVLPHLFPSPDREAFAGVLARALGPGHPEPSGRSPSGTDLTALAALPTENYFAAEQRRRIVIVITDAESSPIDDAALQNAFRTGPKPAFVLVRVGRSGERVHDSSGQPELSYVAVAGAGALGRLVATVASGSAFSEGSVQAAVRAVADAARRAGPTSRIGRGEARLALAPWALAAAALPLAFLVVLRNIDLSRRPTPRRTLATLRPARRRSSVG